MNNAGDWRLLVTCEHGGNAIPPEYAACFSDAQALLDSHRGHDAGAAALAEALAGAFGSTPIVARTSRLLVDLNRSTRHPHLFSKSTRTLPRAARDMLLSRHYFPHRQRIMDEIETTIAAHGKVVHIASHSFTPVLDGDVRNADIGLLFDPGRHDEARLCRHWQAAIASLEPSLRVRRNYPYRGTADGLTTALRRRYNGTCYAGIELECNQALLASRDTAGLAALLAATLEQALHAIGSDR